MPLLKPITLEETQEILSLAKKNQKPKELKQQLEDAGLSIAEIIQSVSDIMTSGENAGVRLKAATIAAELHGLLDQETTRPTPQINIVIKDTRLDTINGVNPILIPREAREANAFVN